MLNSITCIKKFTINNDKNVFIHELSYDNYNQIITTEVSPPEVDSVAILNNIFYSIIEEYRHTKYCPFVTIKALCDGKLWAPHTYSICNGNNIRATNFYKKYKKTLDKILIPESISPLTFSDVVNSSYNGTYVTSIIYPLQYTTTATTFRIQ